MKKYWYLSLVFSLLFAIAVQAQQPPPVDYKRNDDASFSFSSVNKTPAYGSVTRYGEVFTTDKTGLVACSAAAITTADTLIVTVAANSVNLVSQINCYNNSTVASIITIKDNTVANMSDIIGTTTLGTNRIVISFPKPLKFTSSVRFAMTTTATSTICCANYLSMSTL